MKQDKLISICENYEFQRLYRRGKSYVSPSIVMYVGKNRQNLVRCGITTSKKVGNAVLRSRSRRVIREGFRPLLPFVKEGTDIIFVSRGKTPYLKSTRLTRDIKKILLQARLYDEETVHNPD